jgi:hypothetical protein
MLGDSTRNISRAPTRLRKPAGPLNNLILVYLSQLAEPRTTLHFLTISFYELVDAGVQKTNAPATAVENEFTTYQALLTPS